MNDPRGFLVHCALFVLLTWLASIVYFGLRREDVREIVVAGTRWAFGCIVIVAIVGVVLQIGTRWL